jgi:DNA repair protein RecN (Recombination protein N)
MLTELAVSDLGVISSVRLELGPGMTALTGETGAGKTLLVQALALLSGARADSSAVRPGAAEALVQARLVGPGGGDHLFDPDDPLAGEDSLSGGRASLRDEQMPLLEDHEERPDEEELVLARAVSATGRSRAWIGARMATAAQLASVAAPRLELHGQHAYQRLFAPAAQREALDHFAGIDLAPLRQAESSLAAVREALARLGGDEQARRRELDLLEYQLAEIGAVAPADPEEDQRLASEEALLAEASAHREAALDALAALGGADMVQVALEELASAAEPVEEDAPSYEAARRHARGSARAEGRVGVAGSGRPTGRAAVEALADGLAALGEAPPLAEIAARVRDVAAVLEDLLAELRSRLSSLVDDPARLAAVQARRRDLAQLCRKYGPTLPEVLAFAAATSAALESLRADAERADALEAGLVAAEAALAAEEEAVRAARAAAAPVLAEAVQSQLRPLALGQAAFRVEVAGRAGRDVSFLLAANPGDPPLPLQRVASGGELARVMLALRLVLSGGPPTMVFDEVDAGVGGEAALAVGAALARLARTRQVLVVTHLAQVAAFADAQVALRKDLASGRAETVAEPVQGPARLAELARMLSGHPDSATARRHAAELLAAAEVHQRDGLLR